MEDNLSLNNPWINIWFNPRRTIRQIVDLNPSYYVLPLALFSGVANTLDTAIGRSLGDRIDPTLLILIILILGPLGGLLSLYIGGAILQITGSWLGGKANSEEVRAAIAWASVPSILIFCLDLLFILMVGLEAFTSETPILEARLTGSPVLAALYLFIAFVLAIAGIILGIWSFVLLLKCLGEVHQFSAWRALAASLIPAVAILLPLFLCILVFSVASLA